MNTVKELRQAGYVVKVRHNRIPCLNTKLDRDIDTSTGVKSKGGSTEVAIYHELGHLLTKGNAVCCQNDNYSRKLGLTIALGRALKNHKLQNI